MLRSDLPTKGFVFWPVGTGDSTTILVSDDVICQVDINHVKAADSSDDPRYPVVDELVELLPRRKGRPYLAAYIATHHDLDHCGGFGDLEERVLIGELWFTPRLVADIDGEDSDQLSDDAKALRDEAMRRLEKYRVGVDPFSGDRFRVVGYHESLEGDFAHLDSDVVSVPGSEVSKVDGLPLAKDLRLFVHSPFKDDMESDNRNRTSIGLQVTLKSGVEEGRALLLGDLDYEPVKRLLEVTADVNDKKWDVLLAPHHCSKTVMYERVNGRDLLRRDVLDLLEEAKADSGWVVSSSEQIPGKNSAGDNPPHAKAKNRYSEICETFLCTGEHPDATKPTPIIFEVDHRGVSFLGTEPPGGSGAKEQIEKSRGSLRPVVNPVGFGRC